MLRLGFLALFPALGSFPFSISSRLSVTFSPFSRPRLFPKWAPGGFLRSLICIQPPPPPAPLLPPAPPRRRTELRAVPARRLPTLLGFGVIRSLSLFFPGARRQRWGLRDAGGTRPGQRGLWALRRVTAVRREMPLGDSGAARRSGQHHCGVTGCEGTRDTPYQDQPAPDVSRTGVTGEDEELWPELDDGGGLTSGRGEDACRALQRVRSGEALMAELSERVQKVVRSSSWWERHGVDICILSCSLLALPAGFLCLRSAHTIPFLVGVFILGVGYHTLAVKGSHLASHNALTKSKSWGKMWAVFFIEFFSAFTAEQASYNHVKLHHGYTNVIGLGDSSTWKLPFLNRYIYMFIMPLAVPIITPLVALDLLRNVEMRAALRTVCIMLLGLCCHYCLLRHVSGFQSPWSALLCMLLTRSLLAHPYIHVNIFQHIGLPMFAADRKPKRIQQMSLGVLNLPRNALLDWCFGHSLISCHVEHHLFPSLSDNMCLKIKPIVSQYLKEKQLPYNEDTYGSRLRLFLQKYEELMVHAPPITELVGIQ